MMNFESSFYRFLNIRKNANLMVKNVKCDFVKGWLPKYFFQEIYSSGGKQTIHKVSAAFIVKNCDPRTSLISKTSYEGFTVLHANLVPYSCNMIQLPNPNSAYHGLINRFNLSLTDIKDNIKR